MGRAAAAAAVEVEVEVEVASEVEEEEEEEEVAAELGEMEDSEARMVVPGVRLLLVVCCWRYTTETRLP